MTRDTTAPKVRVLCVDDSSTCRALLREILETDGDILVVDEADGADRAKHAILASKPDLVTMDLRMPDVDGLEIVEWIMAVSPRPVLVVSGLIDGRDARISFEAIKRGALDVAAKPDASDAREGARLRDLVRALARVKVVRHVRGARPLVREPKEPPPRDHDSSPPRDRGAARSEVPLIAIGASAGGPAALASVCGALPRALPACVAVVQHLPVGFARAFAEFLQSRTGLRVVIAQEPRPAAAGTLVLPPDDAHLVLDADHRLGPSKAPKAHGHRPSVDVLFASIAAVHGRCIAGAVLSGMGRDGAEGLAQLRARGATTIAQDEASCPVFGMPRAAIEAGAAEIVLPVTAIGGALLAALGRSSSLGSSISGVAP